VKNVSDFTPVIIPAKNIVDIIRILESIDEDIEILFDKNQIAFEATGVYLVSRVIDGTFPDYKQIIPKSHNTEVISLKNDIIDSFKASNIFSDKFNQIHVRVSPKDKIFEIQTKNSDIGEFSKKISASLSGDDIEMNFNHKYISDSFQSIESDSLSFTFNSQNKPLIIQGVSDKSFLYLVMPMNK
jgi:DNA polymerase-3 subunit beta